MDMTNEDVIRNIDRSISALKDEFELHPQHFFTENDLVCRLYQLMSESIPDAVGEDLNGIAHRLIHTEYPTPFRCSMAEKKFAFKAEDDRVGENGKYKRGHYDVVFINPKALRRYDSRSVMSQDYALVKEQLRLHLSADEPLILCAIEIMFHRGTMSKRGLDGLVDMIVQDHEKMEGAISNSEKDYSYLSGKYLREIRTLAFVTNKDDELIESLRARFKEDETIRIIAAR